MFNFSAIFVPVPLCKLLRTWSSFLSILLCSKYLQSNFEVPGPCGSLSWGLSFTVTLYFSAYFTPQHTLLPRMLFSSAHFASWNTLLPRTLCFLCSREQSMLWRTFYKGAKCSREQSVPRSRVFQEAKCAGEQSVSGSKVFQGYKCVEEQNVLRSKV